MMKSKMYVRCPADIESVNEPRVFVCGQITGIAEFKKTVYVITSKVIGQRKYLGFAVLVIAFYNI